jgi:hypothetical protein
MPLTTQEIANLLHTHKSELSALNALVKLIQDGGSSLILQNNSALNRTPNYLRVTNSGAVNVPTYSLSVANIGLADGTFLGTLLRPGEVLNFDAGSLNNVYPSGVFAYDATGTEFIIIYNS